MSVATASQADGVAGLQTRYFAALAWIGGAWARDVLLSAGSDGNWSGCEPGADPCDAVRLTGPVLPALVNAHSHAFQRAMAGFTEQRAAGANATDDFWSWRERMYAVANRITPAQMEAIASFLYAELLAGGYTQVCEFHYLHNDLDGAAYADPGEMALALVRAAARVGIGLTLLPTLYMRSGFAATGLAPEQRRFASTPDGVMRLAEDIARQAGPLTNAGVAIHSLRAVPPGALDEVAQAAVDADLPLHIHVAEQEQEVMDCIAHTGRRPLEWLLARAAPAERWNLVHATHANRAELADARTAGAAVVLCPATEANLGDGVFDLPAYAGGIWSIGSDSHVNRAWPLELQTLEYMQRAALRRRNVAARCMPSASSATALYEAALAGGRQATACALGGIAPGNRADFLVLDGGAQSLAGVPDRHLLDALVFSTPGAGFAEVHVAGRRVISTRGQEACATSGMPELKREFIAAMRALQA